MGGGGGGGRGGGGGFFCECVQVRENINVGTIIPENARSHFECQFDAHLNR